LLIDVLSLYSSTLSACCTACSFEVDFTPLVFLNNSRNSKISDNFSFNEDYSFSMSFLSWAVLLKIYSSNLSISYNTSSNFLFIYPSISSRCWSSLSGHLIFSNTWSARNSKISLIGNMDSCSWCASLTHFSQTAPFLVQWWSKQK